MWQALSVGSRESNSACGNSLVPREDLCHPFLDVTSATHLQDGFLLGETSAPLERPWDRGRSRTLGCSSPELLSQHQPPLPHRSWLLSLLLSHGTTCLVSPTAPATSDPQEVALAAHGALAPSQLPPCSQQRLGPSKSLCCGSCHAGESSPIPTDPTPSLTLGCSSHGCSQGSATVLTWEVSSLIFPRRALTKHRPPCSLSTWLTPRDGWHSRGVCSVSTLAPPVTGENWYQALPVETTTRRMILGAGG